MEDIAEKQIFTSGIPPFNEIIAEFDFEVNEDSLFMTPECSAQRAEGLNSTMRNPSKAALHGIGNPESAILVPEPSEDLFEHAHFDITIILAVADQNSDKQQTDVTPMPLFRH